MRMAMAVRPAGTGGAVQCLCSVQPPAAIQQQQLTFYAKTNSRLVQCSPLVNSVLIVVSTLCAGTYSILALKVMAAIR